MEPVSVLTHHPIAFQDNKAQLPLSHSTPPTFQIQNLYLRQMNAAKLERLSAGQLGLFDT